MLENTSHYAAGSPTYLIHCRYCKEHVFTDLTLTTKRQRTSDDGLS